MEQLEIDSIDKCVKKIREKISPITILGLSDVSKIYIQNNISERQNVLLTYNELQAQKLYKNLKAINSKALYLPKKDIVTYEYDAQNLDIFYQRQEALISMYNKEKRPVILTIETLMQPTISKKTMQNNILKFMVANTYDIEKVKEKLVDLGYERYELVEGKGTFSVRGDILDVGISNKTGIRIEFFGDEVDQIRYFEIASQRSTEVVNQIRIYPFTEQIEKEPKGIISEYFEDDVVVFLDEISKIKTRSNNILNDNKYIVEDLIEKDKKIPYILENMYDINKIEKSLKNFQIIYLEEQDIIKNRENTITISHDDIKKIEESFKQDAKQEKENKTYRPRKKHSKEFTEGEKVVFSDLKIRRLYCS